MANDEYATFSINMGVRYEVETSPTEVNNLTDPKMPTLHGVGPRFGFAWNPLQPSFRAGVGNQYAEFGGRSRAGQSRPDHEADSGRSTGLVPILYLLSPDLVLPYTHMYNFALEWALPAQTLVRLTYMGSRSFHLLTQGTYNRLVVDMLPNTPVNVKNLAKYAIESHTRRK